MGCLKLSYDQGEGVEENPTSIFWQVYSKRESASKKCIEYYRYGFQGEFSMEDMETGWNSFELRNYDSEIGRWNAVDPYRQYWSPYVGMGNNPTNNVDPDGGCATGDTPCIEAAKAAGFTSQADINAFVNLDAYAPGMLPDNAVNLDNILQVGQPLNTSLTKTFDQAQLEAAYESAVVISITYEFIKSQFQNENHGSDGTIAMSPPMPFSPAKTIKWFKDYNRARNAAIKWLEARGFKAQKSVLGKFGTIKGKPIGMKTLDGKIGFRIEHDARHGAHINVWSGKEKMTFEFGENVTEATVTKLQNLFK